jgi:hypothetical protein
MQAKLQVQVRTFLLYDLHASGLVIQTIYLHLLHTLEFLKLEILILIC